MIKRFLIALVATSVLISFLIAYEETEYSEKEQRASVAARETTIMEIPEQAGVNDPSVFWPILKEAALQSGVNVYRKADGFGSDNKPFVTYYVFLTQERTKVLNAFRLQNGRFPSAAETQEASVYLSSVPSNDPRQIGVIDDIGRNDCYYVYGLEEAFSSYKVAGSYYIESTEKTSRDFYNQLVELCEKEGFSLEINEIHDKAYGIGQVWGYETGIAQDIVWFVVIATIIMIFYRQIDESKRSAVLLLYGNTRIRTWYMVSGILLIRLILVLVPLAVVGALLVPGTTVELVLKVLGISLGLGVLFVASSLLTLIIICRINLQEALKNRKDTFLLVLGNLVVKGVLSLMLISMGAATFGQYQNAQNEREQWGSWQSTSQYGIFYPLGIGRDGSTDPNEISKRIVFDVYPVLNSDGALFVNAADFASYAIEDGREGYRSITVNPNYLEVYPVKDADGNYVRVPETESEWVLLVPETMRAEENSIKEFYENQRSGGEDSVWAADEHFFGRSVENPQTDQKVRIIWTQANQRVFAFNPEVCPDDGNCVVDPIVAVMTATNSSGMDRAPSVGGGPDNALKVKLGEAGSTETYQRYIPLLEECGLDDNLRQIVTMDEFVFTMLQHYDQSVSQYAFQMVLIFLLYLALVLQSVPLIFELDSRRTAVRKLYGYSFGARNRFFFTVLSFNWLALFALASLFNSVFGWPWKGYSSQDPLVILVATGLFLLIELLVSSAVLSAVERRRVVDVLKGGF